MRNKIIFIIYVVFSSHLVAQNRKIDSLSVLLIATSDTSDQINLKCQISQLYSENGEFKKAGELAYSALMLAESINHKKGVGSALYSIARLNLYVGHSFKALKLLKKAESIFKDLRLQEELGWTYLNMGICIAAEKNIIEARKLTNKALQIFQSINHKKGVAYSYLNLGKLLINEEKNDDATHHLMQAKNICTEINDSRGLGYVLGLISTIHVKAEDYDKALENIKTLLSIRESENNKMDMSWSYVGLGNIYLKQGSYKKAEQALITGEELGIQAKADDALSALYLIWSEVDSLNGNCSQSKQHFKMHNFYNNLVSSEYNQHMTTELQHTYTEYKKEKEIILMKQELKNALNEKDQRNLIIGLSAIAGVLLIVVLFSINLSKRADRIRRQKNIISKQKEQTDLQHKSITDSIIYAKKIQQALITNQEYIAKYLNLDFFIHFVPKDIVSGDFYWAQKHKGAFYLITADCTGHGVPGAFMSLLNISIMNELIVEKNLVSPAKILNEQRQNIIKSLNSEKSDNNQDGMDCVLCKFETGNNLLTFSAANSSLWIVRNSEVLKFKGNKMPVGKYLGETKNFTEQKIELLNGDLIYTFTDGVVDQFGGEKNKKFKPRKLSDLLLKIHHLPMAEQNTIIKSTLEKWTGDYEQTDDILMIGVKYNC